MNAPALLSTFRLALSTAAMTTWRSKNMSLIRMVITHRCPRRTGPPPVPAMVLPFSRPLLNDAPFSLRRRPGPDEQTDDAGERGQCWPSTAGPRRSGPTVSGRERELAEQPADLAGLSMLPFHCPGRLREVEPVLVLNLGLVEAQRRRQAGGLLDRVGRLTLTMSPGRGRAHDASTSASRIRAPMIDVVAGRKALHAHESLATSGMRRSMNTSLRTDTSTLTGRGACWNGSKSAGLSRRDRFGIAGGVGHHGHDGGGDRPVVALATVEHGDQLRQRQGPGSRPRAPAHW